MLTDLCKKTFDDIKVEVILFGSRAKNSCRPSSDIDLAVKSRVSLGKRLSLFREYLEESTIPYTVDTVEYNIIDEQLKKEIDENGVLLWKN